MKREVRVYLQDIVDSIELIEQYAADITKDEFSENLQVQDAILRRLAIIGEATKHIPKRVRDHYPDIPWRQIAGTRDILIHEYFDVQLQTSWEIVRRDLAMLKAAVKKVRADLDKG